MSIRNFIAGGLLLATACRESGRPESAPVLRLPVDAGCDHCGHELADLAKMDADFVAENKRRAAEDSAAFLADAKAGHKEDVKNAGDVFLKELRAEFDAAEAVFMQARALDEYMDTACVCQPDKARPALWRGIKRRIPIINHFVKYETEWYARSQWLKPR